MPVRIGARNVAATGLVAAAILGLPVGSSASETEAKRLTPAEAERSVARLATEVERIRGLGFRRPVPVRVVDAKTARAHMARRLRLFGRKQIESVEQAYALLELVPAGTGVLDALLDTVDEQAVGYYDPDRGRYYVLDHVPVSAVAAVTVHELTHALEDQHYDLDKRFRRALDDGDLLFALGSVHEGSATLVMLAWAGEAMARGEEPFDALPRARRLHSPGVAASPPAIQREILAPYLLGPSFLMRGDPLAIVSGLSARDLERAFRDGPRSSEQILHPEKFWDPERLDPPKQVRLPDLGPLLGRGFRRVGAGVLGEITLGVLVGAPLPDSASALAVLRGDAWTNSAAAGWGGDRWELWRRKQEDVLVVLTAWDTETDAVEFATALPQRVGLAAEREGDRVALVAGGSPDTARRVLSRLTGPLSRAAPADKVGRLRRSRDVPR